jgi:CBS domain-containing protein
VSELGVQPERPTVELRVALAGPLASLGLGVLGAIAAQVTDWMGAPALVTATLSWLATVNILLGVFNLLPGFPLDGGRVLHGLLWWRSGDRGRATRMATGACQLLGSLLAGLGLLMALGGRWDGVWLVIVGWFLTGAATGERAHAAAAEHLQGLTVADAMTHRPQVAPGWWTVRAFADSLHESHQRDAAAPRHRAFPVVDMNGRPIGVIRMVDLARVGSADPRSMTVKQLALPCPDDMLVTADEPLERVAENRYLLAGGLLVVRRPDGDLAGVLSSADLGAAATLGVLRPREPRGPEIGSLDGWHETSHP